MTNTFFFYDLETTGFSPSRDRIMQFAGQRTDLKLKPIGKSTNILIKLTNDVLPDPEAILTTGITPQQTLTNGISEADFLEVFNSSINIPNTTFVGYNNVRFDDEFMRFLQYRNLYDPYTWQWQDGRSRFDMLDLVRMTRALRPGGIKWPVDEAGRPTNRLELLTSLNKLSHIKAHDALSDVLATIRLAQLLLEKQPKLFHFLYDHRNKKQVAEVVYGQQPFIYTSGKYPSEFEKTTVVCVLTDHPSRQGVLVFDLRYDPRDFVDLSVEELARSWQLPRDDPSSRLPVKTLLFNRCPAVAPLSVLEKASQERLKIDLKIINTHQLYLKDLTDFPKKILKALAILDRQRHIGFSQASGSNVDNQLYDSFFSDADRKSLLRVHATQPSDLIRLSLDFQDRRINELLPLFIARNYPDLATSDQLKLFATHRRKLILSGGANSRFAKYTKSLSDISAQSNLSAYQKNIIKELRQWATVVKSADETADGESQSR